MQLTERFFRYVTLDTQSQEDVETVPSTPGQFVLADLLVEELKALGLKDAERDGRGYVMATLPGNVENTPVIGLIAHLDTAPDFSGKGVTPRIVANYDGGDIPLSETVTLSPKDYPEMLAYVGQDLIVPGGDTLLGADDKAGIAEIMTALETWVSHPEIPRCTVRIGFTPDEEVGRGADFFDVDKFGADFAYTLDGGPIGELEYENFNAASATIHFKGNNIHPGYAKGKMVNAIGLAHQFMGMLPPAEKPEYTDGYEGFFMVTDIEGTVENTTVSMIIRDHSMDSFQKRKQQLEDICGYLDTAHGAGTVSCEMKDSYYNMKEKILPVYHVVETAEAAMKAVGVEPLIRPIRGGTDGARLSFMGLPTPNLFAGGHNFHGKHEFVPVQSMVKAVETVVEIVKRYAEK